MDKVIYFTATVNPTPAEIAEIALFNAANREIAVRSKVPLAEYGGRIEPCDFVAGSVPTEYSAKPVATPGGGGGATLPEGLNMLGIIPYADEFTIAVNATQNVANPVYYSVLNGVISGASPEGIEVSLGAIPAGGLPGFDGAVSFTGNQMTGVTEGAALFSVNLTLGIAGPGQISFVTYIGVTVSGGI